MPAEDYVHGMMEGVLLYGKHGFQTVGKDISSDSYFAGLSEVDQQTALKLGQGLRELDTNRKVEMVRAAIERARMQTDTEVQKSTAENNSGEIKNQFKGVAPDGKKIYESNFPKGTPKAAKSERILDYVKKVWSKKPITLVISNGETSREIQAQFDPTVPGTSDGKTDATKISGGNRHGSASERRVTLNLADDYHEITSDAKYDYSKLETGKNSETHKGVRMWHYFVNEIYFMEQGSDEKTPYTVTINVKEKDDGSFVYSYNAEKDPSTRRTLHADVRAKKGPNGEIFFDDSIPQNPEIVKGKVFYDERINLDDLTQKQRDEIAFAGTVIAAIGNTVHFYNSQYAPKDSREARTNGWYDPKDGSIHLDIAKIERGEESVLFTLSHELVHFIEDWSPAKYQTFANFLLKNYAEHDVPTDKLVHEKMAELKTTDYDYAMSELVADACERMLLDSNAAQKLAELNKTDKGLAQKIKDFFANVLNRIRNAYANYKGRTEAQYLQKMDDVLSEFHALFEDALIDAARNYQDADGKLGVSEVREQAKKYPLAKKKNSWYNQYRTVALQWAYSDRTKPGDRKVVYEAGKGYHLIEAMEDGYFEVFTGSYEEVERYDSAYRSPVETFYGNIEALSNDERGNIRNLRYDRNGRHDVGHGESVPGGHDASRSDEHLRSSNKGKSSFVEKDQAKEQRKLNSTREILTNVDLKTADLSNRGGDQLAAHLKDYQEKEKELKKHEAKVRSLSEKILKMRHDREKGYTTV